MLKVTEELDGRRRRAISESKSFLCAQTESMDDVHNSIHRYKRRPTR